MTPDDPALADRLEAMHAALNNSGDAACARMAAQRLRELGAEVERLSEEADTLHKAVSRETILRRTAEACIAELEAERAWRPNRAAELKPTAPTERGTEEGTPNV